MSKLIKEMRAEIVKIRQLALKSKSKVKQVPKKALQALQNLTEQQRAEIKNRLEIYAHIALDQINRLNILNLKTNEKTS